MRDNGTRWWDQANCRDVDPTVFEQPRRWSASRHSTLRGERVVNYAQKDPWIDARRVCADCPVRLQCLEDALTEEPMARNYGHEMFVAGLEPRELVEMRRQREQNLRRSRAVR